MDLNRKPLRPSRMLLCLYSALLLCSEAALAQNANVVKVVQFGGAKNGQSAGKQVMLVIVAPIGTRRAITLAVPNKEDKPQANPKDEIANVVKGLKPGDLVKIEVEPPTVPRGIPGLKSIAVYEPKPGELQPNVYVYEISSPRQEAGKRFTGVVLTRLGETTVGAVPPGDDAMEEFLVELKPGTLVEVNFQSKGKYPTIATIDPYQEMEPATFVAQAEAEVEGEKVPAIEIKLASQPEPIKAILTGKQAGKRWVPEPKLASTIKRLKPDQELMVRVVKVGDNWWLRRFTASKPPKGGAAKPAKGGADAPEEKPESGEEETKGKE